MAHFLGLDLGTSGCRGCITDEEGRVIDCFGVPIPGSSGSAPVREQDPQHWWRALQDVVGWFHTRGFTRTLTALAVDGTSGTVVTVDRDGKPLGPALMYDDARAQGQADAIREAASPGTAANGPSSALAKALWIAGSPARSQVRRILSPSDWINTCLSEASLPGDENNALKLGYDPVTQTWPAWLSDLDLPPAWLPEVVPAGTPIGAVSHSVARKLGLPVGIRIVAGTTDSIAGFIATGARDHGEAVTSLGTTLALKILSAVPVYDSRYGVYSHRLQGRWLVGGASNSGGGVLRRFFSDEEINRLSAGLPPNPATGLGYYPLPSTGERFPVADPRLQPRLEPRPADRSEFLKGILEGIAEIERAGYVRFQRLGTPYPLRVHTVGGGANNPVWTAIRRRTLGVDVVTSPHREAAYGASRLARDGIMAPHE